MMDANIFERRWDILLIEEESKETIARVFEGY